MNELVQQTNGNGMVQAGEIQRQELGTTQIQKLAEMATVAAAAQAEAAVRARYAMAIQRPRDVDLVRVKMMAACRRPGFAAVARYRKPVGGGHVEGFSIRFAEEVFRNMGNIYIESPVVFDDSRQRLVSVRVSDLESNNCLVTDVALTKTVERKKLKANQRAISTRMNSQGEIVHVVEATDDDILNKQGSLISKAMRNGIMRLFPGDIADECKSLIYTTLDTEDAKDPAAVRKGVVDTFATINVMPDALKEYLECDIAMASPAQLAELRSVFQAIRDGETTWPEVMRERDAAAPSAPAKPTGEAPRTVAELKAQAKKEAGE